jgi:hypothetical protein
VTWALLLLINPALLQQQKPPDLSLSVAQSGQILVRVQPLAQWLGAAVSWSSADKCITLEHDRTQVKLWVNRDTMQVSERATRLAERPRILDEHVVAPLRPIVEAFGGTVEFRAAENVVVIRAGANQLRAALPHPPRAGAQAVYHAGYPADTRLRAAWICTEQFLYALRDGRIADAEARCTPGFIADYGGRLLRPLRPYRLEVFELTGWRNAPRDDVYVRVSMHTRDVTSRTTQQYDFRLTEVQGEWRLASAVRR